MEKINRGDLYYADLDNKVIGSEERGTRPVVILQNNVGNRYSPTVIVAPLTSKIEEKAQLPTHIILDENIYRLPKKSMILVEQITVIDKKRLRGYIGLLDTNELEELEKGLLIALGFKKIIS